MTFRGHVVFQYVLRSLSEFDSIVFTKAVLATYRRPGLWKLNWRQTKWEVVCGYHTQVMGSTYVYTCDTCHLHVHICDEKYMCVHICEMKGEEK